MEHHPEDSMPVIEGTSDDASKLLLQRRRSERARFTKRYEEAKHLLSVVDITQRELDKAVVLIQQIEASAGRLRSFNEMLAKPLAACNSEKALDTIFERELAYEDNAIEAICLLRNLIEKNDKRQSQVAGNENDIVTPQTIVCTQLKPDEVPKFAGDVKRFREWHQLFEVYVHNNASLSPIQKFKALKNSLVGSAAREIAYFDFTAEQYPAAYERVKCRFGNEEDAEREHIQQIRQLCLSRDLDKAGRLAYFTSGICQNVRALTALGKPSSSLSITLTPMILDCLPYQQKSSFLRGFNAKKKAGGELLCELEELLEFLEEEVTVRRSIGTPRGPTIEQGHKQYQQSNVPKYNSKPKASVSAPLKTDSRYSFQTTATPADHSCIFCSGDHRSFDCKKTLSLRDKQQRVATENACRICLRRNHTASKCRKKVSCQLCKARHYAILCPKADTNTHSTLSTFSVQGQRTAELGTGNQPRFTLLRTGYAWIGNDNTSMLCRIVLDNGSQRSYVSQRVIEKLRSTPVDSETLITYTIGGSVSKVQHHNVHNLELRSQFDPAVTLQISALEINEVTKGILPTVEETFGLSPIADHTNAECSQEIELLLGADSLAQLHTGEERIFDNIVATRTKLGWFFCGHSTCSRESRGNLQPTLCGYVTAQPCMKLPSSPKDRPFVHRQKRKQLSDIEFLWDIEMLGWSDQVEEDSSENSTELQRFFEETINRLPDGRYVISLPFNENLRFLGSNEHLSRHRLKGFLEKARRNKTLLSAVDNEIHNYIKMGYAEPALPKRKGELAHYLPIVAVAKNASAHCHPTGSSEQRENLNVRVVKDAGARSPDLAALNDVLYQGPNLLPDILKVLLYFRNDPIAIVTDIEKAFLQFRINPAQKTFLRFLWPLGISENPDAPVTEFWANVLDFGLVCSPWLHCAGIRYHLENALTQYPEHRDFIRQVSENFYVDDIVAGANNTDTAIERVQLLHKIFKSGHFLLKKWATNSAVVGKFITDNATLPDITVTFNNEQFKFLGIAWNQSEDSLGVLTRNGAQTLKGGNATKRRLLKGLAQIFDPLGILAPVTINAKILLQKLWLEKRDWEDILSGDNLDSYSKFADNILAGESIRIPRAFTNYTTHHDTRTELHIFSDASLKAYGCVAYIYRIQPDSPVCTRFIMAKSRVRPLKGTWTIPRLELMAAVMAARSVDKLKQLLPFKLDAVVCHSDSQVVLAWIFDSAERWKAFVRNRVREIQNLSVDVTWCYVKSNDNPADLLSRGSPFRTANIALWLNGPDTKTFSATHTDVRDHNVGNTITTDIVAEQRPNGAVSALAPTADATAETCKATSSPLDGTRYSTFNRAVRVLAYVRRLLPARTRTHKHTKFTTDLQADEIIDARRSLLHMVQATHFARELATRCIDITKNSRIYQLRPFVDDCGLIRCRTRLEKSEELSFDERCPIILPGDDPFVNLLVKQTHACDCLHSGGIPAILHGLRKQYFILRARRAAKKALSSCMICTRYKAVAATEPIPPIPRFRLERSPPFTFSGVDFAGPLRCKNDEGTVQKSYITLFVCAVTRAVHIELIPNLTTSEFLLALRKFISRYPTVSKIFSDNAQTFRRAAKELQIITRNVKDKNVQNTLASSGITWQFITERAPWQGGWWERLVQTIKRPLRKVIGTSIPQFRELATTLAEIEATINRRPLTAVPSDVNEVSALSPADLLYGYTGSTYLPELAKSPQTTTDLSAIAYSKRWKYQQSMLNAFWKRFRVEYLQFLTSIHKQTSTGSRPLKVGDICIVKDEFSSRGFWPLARVLEVFGGEGTDRRHRSCTIRLSSGQLVRRPIQLLYRLEI